MVLMVKEKQNVITAVSGMAWGMGMGTYCVKESTTILKAAFLYLLGATTVSNFSSLYCS